MGIVFSVTLLGTIIAWVYGLSIFALLIYGGNLLILSLVHATKEGQIRADTRDPNTLMNLESDKTPFVTIQLPLYNESHVAGRLLDAIAAMSYPKDRFEVQVLDDSTDETTSIVAERAIVMNASGIRVEHIHRTNRDGYKAGALQRGLASATGELIAIFDADFVPGPNFLEQVVDRFTDENVGMVQTRWAHLNENNSWLTRMQAFGLDAHFAIEQRMRAFTSCFINFNGTAGIWRKSCIEDAGGWAQDNLTEDFDLSFRAQLKGWRFLFLPDVEVPAELPVSMNAFRNQQFRWTKGAMQTAARNLRPLWKSTMPLRVKWEGSIHLTASIVFPFLVLVSLCYAPLIYLQESGGGPGTTYFAWMSLGLIGFAGFFLAQVFAQRQLYPTWRRRLLIFPLFMAGGIGMSLNNSQAILEVVFRKKSEFVRTPKHDIAGENSSVRWLSSPYSVLRIPRIAFLEAVIALYSIVGLVYMISAGAWTAAPFQVVFVVGYTFVSGLNVRQYLQSRPS